MVLNFESMNLSQEYQLLDRPLSFWWDILLVGSQVPRKAERDRRCGCESWLWVNKNLWARGSMSFEELRHRTLLTIDQKGMEWRILKYICLQDHQTWSKVGSSGQSGKPHWESEVNSLSSCPALTFKVNGAISIYVSFLNHLGNLPGCELFSQKPLHGLLQLSQGDLPISIGIKLNRGRKDWISNIYDDNSSDSPCLWITSWGLKTRLRAAGTLSTRTSKSQGEVSLKKFMYGIRDLA